ncbi:MAG: prolipoprotein diacylglyceryl transferase [Erysipelotrichaceae bacterium]|nr:prolipoprotein diacylglyceryl transferase [Erysipelotrichaceae bacterium]
MNLFPDMKTVVSFGTLEIKWYAIIILFAAIMTYYLSLQEFKKFGYEKNIMEDFFVYTFGVGLVGARLWFCVFYDFKYYFFNPINLLKVYEGGLAIQGGLVFGALFAYWFLKKRNISFLRMADAIAPNILIASFIGRWANFINQEAFGPIVPESFYQYFPSFIKQGMYIQGNYHLPTFFMESMGCLIAWLLIKFVYRRFFKVKRGHLAYSYLLAYGIIRIYVESFRTDSLYIGPLKMAQMTSLAFIIVAILGYSGLFDRFIKKRKPYILFKVTHMDQVVYDNLKKEYQVGILDKDLKEYIKEHKISHDEFILVSDEEALLKQGTSLGLYTVGYHVPAKNQVINDLNKIHGILKQNIHFTYNEV